MTAWKRLETELHGLAEDFTQGRFGRGSEVDTDALRENLEEVICNYEADLERDENDA